MTKFDISSNIIRAVGGKALAEGLKGNQVIKELNFSGNQLGYNSNDDTDTSGIIAIADVIPGMGAMTSLNLANNNIGQQYDTDGWQYDTDANEYWKEVDGEEQVSEDVPEGCVQLGVIAVANAIKDMGAMTSLNLASNDICEFGDMDGIKAIFSAVKVLVIIMVPFSSLSDLSFNCWLLVFAIIPRIWGPYWCCL
jgi:hypothetical protein